MNDWWSNCLIEALKKKIGNWRNIKIIPIFWHWHFHVMWREIDTGKIWHFTGENRLVDFFFKGRIEEVNEPKLLKWAKREGVKI